MLLGKLLPSFLLLELLLDDFENFNMKGNGGGGGESFCNQGNPQDYVHFPLCTFHGTSIFGAAATVVVVLWLLFYQRE